MPDTPSSPATIPSEQELREALTAADFQLTTAARKYTAPWQQEEHDRFRRLALAVRSHIAELPALLKAREDAKRLLKFAGKALDAVRGDHIGNDWDGGDMLDALIECGLIAPHRIEAPCDPEHCRCAEYDDFPQDCYRPTSLGDTAFAEANGVPETKDQ